MGALDLLDKWEAPQARAAVLGRDGTALATRGQLDRPSRWASITKLLTTYATLIAVEEGIVTLDEPAGPEGSTVRHLLAHAGGYDFDTDRILAPPGTRRIYSNTGYEVAAAVVAERADMPFVRYLTEAVLEPLDIVRTELEGTAAAGLVGPLGDLMRFAAELLRPTLISEETFRMATSVAFPGLAGVLPGWGRHDPLDWGLGFELRDGKAPHWAGSRTSPETFGHFGGSGSFLWVDPHAGVACAALSEREFDDWAVEVWPPFADAVIEEFGAGSGPG